MMGQGFSWKTVRCPNSAVGIANFTERLREIYRSRHRCEFSQAEPTGLKVSIWIPYETKESERLR